MPWEGPQGDGADVYILQEKYYIILAFTITIRLEFDIVWKK